MNNLSVGELKLSDIIQRQIDFLLTNEFVKWDGNDESDKGQLDALKNMLKDSCVLTEHQFESKYLTELSAITDRFDKKKYSIDDDDDDYYES